MLVVKDTVIKLNVLNTKCGSELNETDQREQIAELIIISSELMGYNTRNEDITAVPKGEMGVPTNDPVSLNTDNAGIF